MLNQKQNQNQCHEADNSQRENQQFKILVVLCLINATMFFVEVFAAFAAQSTALLADSLDMLGDALAFAFSLFVVYRGQHWKSLAALIKACLMLVLGLAVLIQAITRINNPVLPEYDLVGLIALLALVANTICFTLLLKHRSDDINMRSVWLCARNDVLVNISVILSALLVWFSQSHWPDVIIGAAIALLVLSSATKIMREALPSVSSWRNRNKTLASESQVL